MLLLKILALEPMNGFAVSQRVRAFSRFARNFWRGGVFRGAALP